MNGVINRLVYDVIVGERVLDLIEKVNDKITEGWVVIGGFSFYEITTGFFSFHSKKGRYSQAMYNANSAASRERRGLWERVVLGSAARNSRKPRFLDGRPILPADLKE